MTLPPLPWSKDALCPYISAETVDVHYEHHHRGYLKKLLTQRPALSTWRQVDEIIRGGTSDAFNNAAQFWNHSYYWRSLTAPVARGIEPSDAFTATLGNPAALRERLRETAAKHFGSGWAWLALDDAGTLVVTTTHDAGNPLEKGHLPLVAIDLWEHAWYLDRRSDRDAYLGAVIDHLVNWQFVEANLLQLQGLDSAKGTPAWSPHGGWRQTEL